MVFVVPSPLRDQLYLFDLFTRIPLAQVLWSTASPMCFVLGFFAVWIVCVPFALLFAVLFAMIHFYFAVCIWSEVRASKLTFLLSNPLVSIKDESNFCHIGIQNFVFENRSEGFLEPFEKLPESLQNMDVFRSLHFFECRIEVIDW